MGDDPCPVCRLPITPGQPVHGGLGCHWECSPQGRPDYSDPRARAAAALEAFEASYHRALGLLERVRAATGPAPRAEEPPDDGVYRVVRKD